MKSEIKVKIDQNLDSEKEDLKNVLNELCLALKNEGRLTLSYLLLDWEVIGLKGLYKGLCEYNVEFDLAKEEVEEEEDENGKTKAKKPFKQILQITDKFGIDPKYISAYKMEERVHPIMAKIEYLLTLNPSAEETFFNNICLHFDTDKERQHYFSLLKRKLEYFGTKFI